MELLIPYFLMALNIYFYMIFGYILLGWIIEIRQSEFYRIYGLIVDPFFRVFRGWFVFGQMDFTPMLGLFLFNMLINLLSSSF